MINWNQYSEFPIRYHFQNAVDIVIEKLLHKEDTLLDVGGGIGQDWVKKSKNAYLLDPYVELSDKYIGKDTYESDIKYDFIVARGSINYLTEAQIKRLIRKLNICGAIILNTFGTPPPEASSFSEVPYRQQSNVQREIVQEKYYYDASAKKIRHELKNLTTGKITHHSFHYYSLDQLKNWLDIDCIIPYRKNSFLLTRNINQDCLREILEYHKTFQRDVDRHYGYENL